MKISAFLSCAAVPAMLFLVSCAHDVPVPEDAEASVWTPKIKNSYSSWQPPREMPKGNAEYEAAFSRAGVTNQADALDLALEPIVVPADNAKEEIIRLDIVGNAPQSCKINGELLPDEMAEAFLKDFVRVNVKTKVVICYTDARYAKQAEVYQKRCKEYGFKTIEVKQVKNTPAVAGKKAARKKAVVKKVVIDRSIPGSSYTVVRGDSLSRIAKKQYRDGNLWQIIYRENQTVLKNNANRLVPGMKLVIPAVKQVK